MDALFQDPGLLQDLALDLHEDLDLPSIQELFVYYDSLYFGSSLGTCVVEWSPQKMTRQVKRTFNTKNSLKPKVGRSAIASA